MTKFKINPTYSIMHQLNYVKLFCFAIVILIIITPLSAQQPFHYTIQVHPNQESRSKILFIEYEIGGQKIKDSILLSNKSNALRKSLPQPVAANIYTNDKTIPSENVFLANNLINITLNSNNISIPKTKLQQDFADLTANDQIRPTYFPLYGELSAKNDTAGLNKLSIIFDSLKKDDVKKSLAFFKLNRTSLLSLFAFSRFTSFFADYSKVKKDYLQLPLWAKNSPDGKNILAKIQGAQSAQLNTTAKNFSQLSNTGKTIRLSNFKGKYLLLDFWASWCAPCRKEHPNLMNVYNTFKRNQFEIIAVSLDNNKQDWGNAIQQDKINWIQISDLRGQQNAIALQYGVQSVPANFLIDPNGVIIGKNLSPEALREKLATLIKL